ncbi:hypothetical protein K3757_03035 [Sulfitobacter sp. S223]|uniref:hypothetical protein n=1 Tax=Sulfitobacter sp. S223 TaxID=2867023 RepID=UPI0021A58A9B|nr:hypothetical protein [Sulfitobacter sp. S223]UWR26925.1 hypothetical protein K3757_03035 [Sulfitobacter sp. S223]
MINRREIIALGGAASFAALSACSSGTPSSRGGALLDQVTIRSFRVDATGAGNVIGDHVETLGIERVAAELASYLNANLAGMGQGSRSLDLTVRVEFASVARTVLGESHLRTTVSASDGSGILIGRLRGETAGPRQQGAEAELRNLVAGYTAQMRQLLLRS